MWILFILILPIAIIGELLKAPYVKPKRRGRRRRW